MAVSVIRNFIAKQLFKQKGAISNNKAVEFSANALENRLKNLGINPDAITSEKELNQILAYVKQAEDQAFQQRFGNMLGGSKFDRKGEVFDMAGKKIKDPKGIMGGTEINEQTLKEGLMKTDNPFSDLVKTTDQKPKTLKEREAEVLARMEKDNKEAVQRIKNRKMVEEAIDNASPGFAGDRKYDAQLVADDLSEKRFGKEFYDLDQKQQMDLYDEALEGLANQKRDMPDPEDFATGGRAGFKGGSYDHNSFEHKINSLKAAFKRYKRGSSTGGRGGKMTFEQFAPLFAAENFATGGRAGFKTGLGKKFLELLKNKKMFRSKDDVPTSVFSEKKGPITIEDMANISPNELRKIRRTQELGLYGETPEILKAGNLFDRFTKKVGSKRVIDYDRAEVILNRKLRGDETLNELLQIEYQTRPGRADGGRIGYANGTPSFEDYLKERGMIEKQRRLEQLMREYQDDLERKKVMQQKQEAKDGGRIGLKLGMTKRAFLKLMGGAGAGIAALKSGLLGFGKGAATKQVAKEVVEQGVRSTPPPYFFELANKIKRFGKPDKVTYQDRVEIHRYTGKNGDDYELIEDLSTGDMKITKDKTGIGTYGDKSYDTINDRTVLEYRKGEIGVKDEGMETQKSFKEPDEYEEYKVEFDQDGTHAGADDITANVQKEIIEEAGDEVPSIKKASGGIARMLGE